MILVLISITASAQNNNCSLKKTFSVKPGSTLRISNKYGDVNCITGKNDSLLICATINILQDNYDLVQKSMKLVDIRFGKFKDTVVVSTSYDKKFFSETMRQGRKRFSVDYLIKMPAYMNLNITDEFGNISIDEISGTLKINLSQGNLSAKRITRGDAVPINSVKVDHGKIDIDELNWMNLTLLNCPSVNIEKARALGINSSISKIHLGDISSLVSYSKSDSYIINSINNIITESTYSEYEIKKLNTRLKAKATYGSINISELMKGFSNIDIVSSQSSIGIVTAEPVSFKADIITIDASVKFPQSKYPGIIKTDVNSSTTILGLAGTDKETRSVITIRATSGNLSIR